MTGFLDTFASIWQDWMPISLGIGFVGLGFILFVRLAEPKSSKPLMIGIVLFGQVFITWFIGFGSMWIIQIQARQELKDFIEQPGLIVKVNEQILEPNNANEIFEILRTLKSIPAHHSNPTKKISIEILSDKDTVTLSARQDSQIVVEYWIFWDKYRLTRSNDVGHVITDQFFKYKSD
jgi:hypothetical protein